MRSMGYPEREQETWAGAEWSSSGGVWSSLQHPLRNGGPSKAPPASAFHTPLLLLLLLSRLLCSLLLLPCHAQQSPPLQGQGLDPWSAGKHDGPVDVFFTVELMKLFELDEQKYTFTALLNFEQSWIDPRASDWFDIISGASNIAQQAQLDSLTPCDDNFTQHSSGNLPYPMDTHACKVAFSPPIDCKKYCTTYGTTTPDLTMCCDMVWLPDVELRNLLDTSQDRVVSDIVKFWTKDQITVGLHRSTQVLGRFTVPLQFRRYPFDNQLLNVFVDANVNSYFLDNNLTAHVPFIIVPSGVFWRQDLLFEPNNSRTGSINGRAEDQLERWAINNVTLACADIGNEQQTTSSKGSRVYLAKQTQNFSSDPYDGYGYGIGSSNAETILNQTCAMTVQISRLSVTAVVQTVVPVAFIAALSFMAFATSPDDLDTRLGTEITLFLALTAIQFVFAAELPQASYLTAFDIFILLSYSLIVLIIFESFVVCYICTRGDHRSRLGQNSDSESLPLRSQESKSLERATGPSGRAEEETAEDGKAESLEDGGRVTGREKHPKSGRVLLKIRVGESFLARNTGKAYKIACWIDACTAIILFTTFLILSIVNFTVGL